MQYLVHIDYATINVKYKVLLAWIEQRPIVLSFTDF